MVGQLKACKKVCRGQSSAGGCEAVRMAQNSPNMSKTGSAANRNLSCSFAANHDDVVDLVYRTRFGFKKIHETFTCTNRPWVPKPSKDRHGNNMNPILQRRFGALEAVLLFRHVAVLSMHTTHSNCSRAYTHDPPHLFSSVGFSAFRQSRGCVCVDARYSAAALHTGSGEKSQLPRTLDGIGADCSVWHSWQ